MDFITTLFHIILSFFLLSLRGSLSKSLKQSGFAKRLHQSECFMSCELLERICLLLSPPFPAALALYICHHCSTILLLFRETECPTLHIYSLANCLWVCAVFRQAAVGPWISGNMVHSWWSPQVLLSCQHCKSMRQFDVLKMQWGVVNDHRRAMQLINFIWQEDHKQEMTVWT